jgi:hypothetical protein
MTAAIVHKNLDRWYFYNCNQCTILDTYIILKSKISQIKVVKKKITGLQIYIYIYLSRSSFISYLYNKQIVKGTSYIMVTLFFGYHILN